jgi:hypothetical protein
MTEPTYNPNAQAELDEVMSKETSQQDWKSKAKNLPIDKNEGSEALRKIREEMGVNK